MPSLSQVMMLSSVPELHGYIDKSQLTEDLGGTLDYCHSRWLCHRTVSGAWALRSRGLARSSSTQQNSFHMTALSFKTHAH